MKPWICALAGAVLALGSTLAQADSPVHHGVYVWHSQALLAPKTQDSELSDIQDYGIDQVYVGLNAQQAADPDGTKAAIASLVTEAARRDMQVYLLLGDPDWIFPENRSKLINLLAQLHPLNIKGLLLDIEIEQLKTPSLADRYSLWEQTISDVTRQSAWPITTVSHWRWFASDDHALLCLGSTGIRYASLMVYSTNLSVIRDKLAIAQSRCPGTRFSLSQSVENMLAPEETWSGKGSFAAIQNKIDLTLKDLPVVSIDWQDWDHLKAMNH